MSCLTKVLNSKIRNIEKIPTEESIKDTSNARKLRCRILASFIPKKVGIFLKFKTSNDIRKIEIAIERHSFIKHITSVNNFASTITKSNLNSPQPAYSENRNTEIQKYAHKWVQH